MIFGGVLVGGQSTRMGRDKASLRFKGQSLQAIAEQAIAPHASRVYTLGPGGLEDAKGFQGPLAGIMAALRHAPEAWWIISACDMPFMCVEAFSWLLEEPREECLALLPKSAEGHVQPTCALYGPGSEALLGELRAPIELAKHPLVRTPQIPLHLEGAWTNINEAEAWERLIAD